MTMKKYLLFFAALFFVMAAGAQTSFLTRGKIEFERKTNVHRLYLTGENDSWAEDFKKMIPQFKTDFFDLVFTDSKSLYKPGRESGDQKVGFFQSPAAENTVYKDLVQQTATSQKQIFESQFLLSDSIHHLHWKIEPETRTIAGFECHKAVARICDSVVVVAFYTDEIIPSSGPESFSGLPGMILGIAIPRLYTTWFATKVEVLNDAEAKKISAPTKGKKSSQADMVGIIKDGIKDWGEKYYHKAIWFSVL
jgi:GLPGLI family protein